MALVAAGPGVMDAIRAAAAPLTLAVFPGPRYKTEQTLAAARDLGIGRLLMARNPYLTDEELAGIVTDVLGESPSVHVHFLQTPIEERDAFVDEIGSATCGRGVDGICTGYDLRTRESNAAGLELLEKALLRATAGRLMTKEGVDVVKNKARFREVVNAAARDLRGHHFPPVLRTWTAVIPTPDLRLEKLDDPQYCKTPDIERPHELVVLPATAAGSLGATMINTLRQDPALEVDTARRKLLLFAGQDENGNRTSAGHYIAQWGDFSKALVVGYVPGTEWNVDVVTQGGELAVLSITSKPGINRGRGYSDGSVDGEGMHQGRHFLECIKVAENPDSPEGRLLAAATKALYEECLKDRLGDGVHHVEWRIFFDESNPAKPKTYLYPIEWNAHRPAGGFLPTMVREATGHDLFAAGLAMALGLDFPVTNARDFRYGGTQTFFPRSTGLFKGFSVTDVAGRELDRIYWKDAKEAAEARIKLETVLNNYFRAIGREKVYEMLTRFVDTSGLPAPERARIAAGFDRTSERGLAVTVTGFDFFVPVFNPQGDSERNDRAVVRDATDFLGAGCFVLHPERMDETDWGRDKGRSELLAAMVVAQRLVQSVIEPQ